MRQHGQFDEETAYHQAGHAVIASGISEFEFDPRKGCARSVPRSLIESQPVPDEQATDSSDEPLDQMVQSAIRSYNVGREEAEQEGVDKWLRFIVAGPVAAALHSGADPVTAVSDDALHSERLWDALFLHTEHGAPARDRKERTIEGVTEHLRREWKTVEGIAESLLAKGSPAAPWWRRFVPWL